ncbi:MAG TPA: PPK2 family polyphosphate kinase [Fimbriimonadaceae bacterium]|nr:PPK2 family polyphosphate kinase [Fimbriimonadaceae bacterium]
MAHAHRIKPGEKVRLDDVKTDSDGGLTEADAREKTAKLRDELEELQEMLYAAGAHGALIVLQGRDTSGKDGTIRHLSTCLNVQHATVSSFKQPTPLELRHDFLWRVHPCVPARGMISIFNRSHYEDVLAVRVHDLAPKKVWKARYDQINEFEALVAANDTVILKFLLHISKGEQERRLLAREQDPDKAWKLSASDWKERALWDKYTEAYEDMLEKCSTDAASWYVVPADHKWHRDLCITEAIVDALKPLRKGWKETLREIARVELAQLAVDKPSKKG